MLLATDLDGTLLYPNRLKTCMPKKNAEFLRRWLDFGNRVVCISSRSLSFKERLEKEVGRKLDFIGASGAQISLNDKVIKDVFLPNDSIPGLIEKIDKEYRPFAFIAVTKDYPFIIYPPRCRSRFLLWFYRQYWKSQGAKGEKYILDETTFKEQIKSGKVYKIIVFFGFGKKKATLTREITKKIREKYLDIEASWSKIVIELTPRDCHKAIGLSEYCQRSHIDTRDVYVVGDSGNDITLFKSYYEHSYCLKHGYPSVKKYAKHIIRRVYNLDKLVLKGEK